MTARSIRRAAERKTKKAARKAARQSSQLLHSAVAAAAPAPLPSESDPPPMASPVPVELPADPEPEPQPSRPTTSQSQIAANRANSQVSTGPNDLRPEYQPATMVEQSYIDRTAPACGSASAIKLPTNAVSTTASTSC